MRPKILLARPRRQQRGGIRSVVPRRLIFNYCAAHGQHTYVFSPTLSICTFGGLATLFTGAGLNGIRLYKQDKDEGNPPLATLTRKSRKNFPRRSVRGFSAKLRRPEWNSGTKSGAAEAGAKYWITTSRNFRENDEDLRRNGVDPLDMEIFVSGRALLFLYAMSRS